MKDFMTGLRRSYVPAEHFHAEQIAPGVTFRRFYPGGMAGPNRECYWDTPGGQQFSESVMLGKEGDDVIMCLPDIRLPPNQILPMHWHDCWTILIIVEGNVLLGDWYAGDQDVFVAAPGVEYGPIQAGPRGCRLFELFGDLKLSPGGYGPEYRDHPTLQGGNFVFKERIAPNIGNKGRSVLPMDGVEGLWKDRLAPGKIWNLGDAGDPDRGVLADMRLGAGESRPARKAGDWWSAMVLSGSAEAGGRELVRDDVLIAAPGGELPEIKAGSEGVQLVEMARTARGMA